MRDCHSRGLKVSTGSISALRVSDGHDSWQEHVSYAERRVARSPGCGLVMRSSIGESRIDSQSPEARTRCSAGDAPSIRRFSRSQADEGSWPGLCFFGSPSGTGEVARARIVIAGAGVVAGV
jgi:hypothetical protein